MKIDTISLDIASIIGSIFKRFLCGEIRRKSGHISEAPTQTAVIKASPRKYKIYNMIILASTGSKDVIEPMVYYREAPASDRVSIFGSHDIATQDAIKPQGEDSLASEEKPYYFFGHDPPAAKNASMSSTEERPRDEELEQRITSLFMMSGEEEFESGMISDFSRDLCSIIDNHGKAATEIISYMFLYKEVNSEVLCEALRWLGRIDQVDSHSYRLWLLEKCLESSSRMIRDGALLGIAAIDDPWAIPAVRKALEKETCRELCDDMKAVLEQLEETTKWG